MKNNFKKLAILVSIFFGLMNLQAQESSNNLSAHSMELVERINAINNLDVEFIKKSLESKSLSKQHKELFLEYLDAKNHLIFGKRLVYCGSSIASFIGSSICSDKLSKYLAKNKLCSLPINVLSQIVIRVLGIIPFYLNIDHEIKLPEDFSKIDHIRLLINSVKVV